MAREGHKVAIPAANETTSVSAARAAARDGGQAMRVLVTGGSGVLGRATVPLLRKAGHRVDAPSREQLDIFDLDAARVAVEDADAVLHLATRIPPREKQGDPGAWRENDRIRREGTAVLVDAALEADVTRFTFPSVAFVYPSAGPIDEATLPDDNMLPAARSALDAEGEVARFSEEGRTGVSLRLGLLYGPGTGSETPAARYESFGATLHIDDAASALLVSLDAPGGVYNVVRDDERVANTRYKQVTGWRPQH